MAFTTVRTDVKYVQYSKCKKGDVLITSGTYQGTSEGKFGIIHTFREDDGTTSVLNKAGQLDYVLSRHAPLGTKCRVVFDGTVKLTKGPMAGKDANQFILQVDNESFTAPQAGQKAAPSAPESLDISL